MTDLVNAGADEVKRANYGNQLEQWRAMQESGCHVATSQRRDVSTSQRFQRRDVGSTNIEVNNLKHRNASTSRRCNVATSVRDLTSSFKVRMAQKSEKGEAYERGHGIPEQSDIDFEEVPGICTVSHFCWILE